MRAIHALRLLSIAALALLSASCSSADDPSSPTVQSVASVSATKPVAVASGDGSIVLSSTVAGADRPDADVGFCYSALPNPTVLDCIAWADLEGDAISATIYGLEPGITYHVKAFVKIDKSGASTSYQVFYSKPAEVVAGKK